MLKQSKTNKFTQAALRFVIFTIALVIVLKLQGTPLIRAFLDASVGGVVFTALMELIAWFRK
ncbi:hypothetical protein [Scytonema sp. NUACC26]|uniref:hypothetical protein n=1 Tax=Scytonema sp. NUACC26 TaxID=3140176 RepID=UPI0034DC8538